MNKNKRKPKLTLVGNQNSQKQLPYITFKDSKVSLSRKPLEKLTEEECKVFKELFLEFTEVVKNDGKIDLTGSFVDPLQNDAEDMSNENENTVVLSNAALQTKFNYGSPFRFILSVIVIPGLFVLACYYFFAI